MAAGGENSIRVEVLSNLDAARPILRTLADSAGFYQSEVFIEAWLATRAGAATPFFVVARDGSGAALALLPLCLRRFGSWRIAVFIGGAESNVNVPLRRADFAPGGAQLRQILREAQHKARPWPHFFALANMPRRWRGAPTLFAEEFSCTSADPYFSVALTGDCDEFLRQKTSGPARKKLRAKQRRLATLGPLRHERPEGPEARAAALAAYVGFQQAAPDFLAAATTGRRVVAFYRRLAEAPDFELHVLRAGERAVAIFGAGRAGKALQGQFIGYDRAPEIACCSPGEILLNFVIADGFARGLEIFALGLGEARYKRQWCDAEFLGMFFHAPSFVLNFWLRPMMMAATAARRRLKRHPKTLALARAMILLVKKAGGTKF